VVQGNRRLRIVLIQALHDSSRPFLLAQTVSMKPELIKASVALRCCRGV